MRNKTLSELANNNNNNNNNNNLVMRMRKKGRREGGERVGKKIRKEEDGKNLLGMFCPLLCR